MQEYCQKLEEEQGTLVAKKDHMEETLTCQSQQLSEMRQKVRQKQSVSSKELEEVRSQLELAQEDRQRLLEVEAKVCVCVCACAWLCMQHENFILDMLFQLSPCLYSGTSVQRPQGIFGPYGDVHIVLAPNVL